VLLYSEHACLPLTGFGKEIEESAAYLQDGEAKRRGRNSLAEVNRVVQISLVLVSPTISAVSAETPTAQAYQRGSGRSQARERERTEYQLQARPPKCHSVP